MGASWPSITPGSLGAPSSPQLCHKHLWPRGCSCAGSFLLSLAQCAPPREVASSLFLAGVLSPVAASSPCVPSNVPVPKLTVSPRQEFSFFPREPSSGPGLPAVLQDRHRFSHHQDQPRLLARALLPHSGGDSCTHSWTCEVRQVPESDAQHAVGVPLMKAGITADPPECTQSPSLGIVMGPQDNLRTRLSLYESPLTQSSTRAVGRNTQHHSAAKTWTLCYFVPQSLELPIEGA